VNFVAHLGKNKLWVGTFERGVEAPTFSCGTGVTAAALAFASKNKSTQNQEHFLIQVPGGNLEVQWTWSKGKITDLRLIGPAIPVFDGIWKG
jgi:diaminopimelate epimerase